MEGECRRAGAGGTYEEQRERNGVRAAELARSVAELGVEHNWEDERDERPARCSDNGHDERKVGNPNSEGANDEH